MAVFLNNSHMFLAPTTDMAVFFKQLSYVSVSTTDMSVFFLNSSNLLLCLPVIYNFFQLLSSASDNVRNLENWVSKTEMKKKDLK